MYKQQTDPDKAIKVSHKEVSKICLKNDIWPDLFKYLIFKGLILLCVSRLSL